jgi:hypothetical protein
MVLIWFQIPSLPAPPPGVTVVAIEGGGKVSGCAGLSHTEPVCGREIDAQLSKPCFVQMSNTQWKSFHGELTQLVAKYKREGLAGVLYFPVIIGGAAFVAVLELYRCQFCSVWIFFGFILLSMLMTISGMYGRHLNQAVDAEIDILLANATRNAGVSACFSFKRIGTSTFAGAFNNRLALTHRVIWISPVAVEADGMGGSTMQVAVPEGMHDGQSMQVFTSNGTMQVTIPQGLQAGQIFSFNVPQTNNHAIDMPTAVPVTIA